MASFRVMGVGGEKLPLLDIKKHTYKFTCSAGYWSSSVRYRDLNAYQDGVLMASGRTSGGGGGEGTGNIYINSTETDVIKGAYKIRFHTESYSSGGAYYTTMKIYINEFEVYSHTGISISSTYDSGDLTFE